MIRVTCNSLIYTSTNENLPWVVFKLADAWIVVILSVQHMHYTY